MYIQMACAYIVCFCLRVGSAKGDGGGEGCGGEKGLANHTCNMHDTYFGLDVKI